MLTQQRGASVLGAARAYGLPRNIKDGPICRQLENGETWTT
jgi:hypothetical protein